MIFQRFGISCLLLLLSGFCQAQQADAILGIWKSDEKVFSMDMYKAGAVYNAKITSFVDHHSAIPSEQRTDERNPNKALRSRKMLGLNIVTNLKYSEASRSWEGGTVYDANSGKTYDASATIKGGKLLLRGYRGISVLGKTLTFHR